MDPPPFVGVQDTEGLLAVDLGGDDTVHQARQVTGRQVEGSGLHRIAAAWMHGQAVQTRQVAEQVAGKGAPDIQGGGDGGGAEVLCEALNKLVARQRGLPQSEARLQC